MQVFVHAAKDIPSERNVIEKELPVKQFCEWLNQKGFLRSETGPSWNSQEKSWDYKVPSVWLHVTGDYDTNLKSSNTFPSQLHIWQHKSISDCPSEKVNGNDGKEKIWKEKIWKIDESDIMAIMNTLIGQDKQKVLMSLDEESIFHRIASEDDIEYGGTCDAVSNRVNLSFKNGRLIKYAMY